MKKPAQEKKKTISLNTKYDFSKVSEMDIIFTLRHLSLMLKAGISLSEALGALEKLTQNTKLKKIYRRIYSNYTHTCSHQKAG